MGQGRTDLRDVTFVIPFCLDLPERLRNLRIVCEFLVGHFETTVVVAEYDRESKLSLAGWAEEVRSRVRHRFFRNPNPYFQRTRSVNLAAREVETPYLAICDTDVLLQSGQYTDGVELLRKGECEMCLPFANRVMWIPRDDVGDVPGRWSDRALDALDYGVSDDAHIFMGLVHLLDMSAFRAAGMMNEHFRSWGFEEMELYMRLLKLGMRVLRTHGRAYHLGHGNGGDTGPAHPHFKENRREYHRVLAMNPDELLRYVRSWPWTQPATGEQSAA